MVANYFDYRELTDRLFYGVGLTDEHMNNATEEIRRYVVDGGAGEVMKALGIGIKVVTREALLLPEETIKRRFVFIDGENKGSELDRVEIEVIGMFLKYGAYYGRFGCPTY